jgi:hypothetical protein
VHERAGRAEHASGAEAFQRLPSLDVARDHEREAVPEAAGGGAQALASADAHAGGGVRELFELWDAAATVMCGIIVCVLGWRASRDGYGSDAAQWRHDMFWLVLCCFALTMYNVRHLK